MPGKAVVLMSGGLDSTTAAYLIRNQGKEVIGLTLHYGQKMTREIQAARDIAKAMGIHQEVVDLSNLRSIWRSNPLTSPSMEIDAGKNLAGGVVADSYYIVPLRNLVLMSIACSFAEDIGAQLVVIGAHGSDIAAFPDCTPEFYAALQNAVRIGTANSQAAPPYIYLPWEKFQKKDIVEAGVRMGVPYELTWSCYANGEAHCGICESCVYRKEAFALVGAKDPTVYAK